MDRQLAFNYQVSVDRSLDPGDVVMLSTSMQAGKPTPLSRTCRIC